jgi:hypothetical protein
MARNSAKNSARFALELILRPSALGSYRTTAFGNLVVDRTDIGFAIAAQQTYQRLGRTAPPRDTSL